MDEKPITTYSRVPGLLWLGLAITGGFGLAYIRSSILVSNDAAATIANVRASEFMFRLALTSTLLSQVITVLFAIRVFQLFRPSSRTSALVVLVTLLITSGFAAFNTVLHSGALFVLSNSHLISGFSAEQVNSLAYAMIRIANGPGQGIIELFWPVTYFTLGLLLIRSNAAPKLLGYVLMIVAVGFLANITNKFLFPSIYPAQFTLFAQSMAAICILPNILWWSIRGLRTPGNPIRAT